MSLATNPDQSKPKPASSKLLQVHHVAARLGLAPRTVRYLAEIGELPGFKIGMGKLWRFVEADIDAYVERKRSEGLN